MPLVHFVLEVKSPNVLEMLCGKDSGVVIINEAPYFTMFHVSQSSMLYERWLTMMAYREDSSCCNPFFFSIKIVNRHGN